MSDNLPPNKNSREYCLALRRLLLRTSNPKLGLSRIRKLLDEMGFDRTSLRIIHVVGTNGKGSTVAFIESLLRARSISCGLFTSPHLCTARERIRINGNLITEEDFALGARQVLDAAARLDDEASFFECMVALAMWAFKKHNVHVAIMEAGLGGRLDATTALDADVLGISPIDYDHQNILGESLTAIAGEKIAAARSNQPVFTVPQLSEAMAAISQHAKDIGCNLRLVEATTLPVGLYGEHQQINAGLALALVQELCPDMTDAEIRAGLLNVNWPGRFEMVKSAVPLVLDGAHNPAGIQVLVDALKSHEQFARRKLLLVYGSLAGNNVRAKIAALKKSGLTFQRIYLHQPRNTRAMAAVELQAAFVHSGFASEIVMFENMAQVIKHAETQGASVVVCGSLYTIGEIRSAILGIAMDHEGPQF